MDSGSSHLDTDAMERDRGITIFSSTASLDWAGAHEENGAHLMLVDAPGHVDFSAEAERTLAALDYAILVVGANDGVQGHTETLWDLLARYEVPTFVFVNKCDLENLRLCEQVRSGEPGTRRTSRRAGHTALARLRGRIRTAGG